MPRTRVLPASLALAVALPLVAAPTAWADVRITELPGLPGYPTHRAVGVNDLGQVIGAAYGNGPVRGVQWTPGGAAVDLGAGNPRAINQRGQVLIVEATSSVGPYVNRPRIWRAGEVVDITPSGSGWVSAEAINDAGQVPMTYSTSSTSYHQERAAVWRGEEHEALPLSEPHLFVDAINDAGVVVGSKLPMFAGDRYAFRCEGVTCTRLATTPGSGSYELSAVNGAGVVVGNKDGQALRWEGGSVTVLSPDGRVARGPQALNERGDVVGVTTDASGVRRATLWPGGGKPVVLDVPGPAEAVAVNERGDVLGWSSADDPDAARAFLWRDGKHVWLGSLGGAHSLPVALNDRGAAVGESTTADGTIKAVKWTVGEGRPLR